MNPHQTYESCNQFLRKNSNLRIVFTNGVFDIIHPGHIELLSFAKSKGDILIVGINTDDSVRRIKGDNKPLFPLKERIEVLEAIEFIDFIVPFSENDPLRLIKSLDRVDVLVKGGDYKPEEVVGRREVESAGGQLYLFQFQSNYSSSSLIKKILNQNFK